MNGWCSQRCGLRGGWLSLCACLGGRRIGSAVAHLPCPSLPACPALPCPALLALQVRTGLGCLPADFDSVVRAAGVAHTASNLARWEAYAGAHMFDPSTAKL